MAGRQTVFDSDLSDNSFEMYILGKLHPDTVELKGDKYKEGWLTRSEKEAQIKRFYSQKLNIPLNIDHEGSDRFGFVYKGESDDGGNVNLGHVVDIFNDKRGDMMIKCFLSDKHPAYRKINQSIAQGERWGVSVFLNCIHSGGGGGAIKKNITHVALTTEPALAEQKTFLYRWALEERKMDAEIAREYYEPENERCFFTGEWQERLAEKRKNELTKRMSLQEQQQQQPAVTGMEQQQQQQDGMVVEQQKDESLSLVPYKYIEFNNQQEIMDLKQEMKRMDDHLCVSGVPFPRQEQRFKDDYFALQSRIRDITVPHAEFLMSIASDETGFTAEKAQRMATMLCNPNPTNIEAERETYNYVAASKKKLDAAYAEMEQMREDMRQQAQFHEDEKRLREDMGKKRSAPFEYGKYTPPVKQQKFLTQGPANALAVLDNSAATLKDKKYESQRQQQQEEQQKLSLLEEDHIKYKQVVSNACFNRFLKTNEIYHEKPVSYGQNSPSIIQFFEILQSNVNSDRRDLIVGR